MLTMVLSNGQNRAASTMTLLLMRGPLLTVTVTAAITLPLLIQLSAATLVCLGLFSVGIVITLRDVATFAEYFVRQRTSNFLDNLVLDDAMRSIFDPETGWIACWISLFVGNASMYTLPMSSEQRVRLIQSCLWTSEEQARSILTCPGGLKVMLPEALQVWLNKDESDNFTETPYATEIDMAIGDDECDRSNQSEVTLVSCEGEPKSPRAVEPEQSHHVGNLASQLVSQFDAHVSRNRGLKTNIKNVTEEYTRTIPPTMCRPPETHPPNPLDAMGCILKEIALDIIKRTYNGIPDSVIRTSAVAASGAFALHLSCSPRARRIVAGAVEGAVALTFASVAVTAMAALVTKAHFVNNGQGNGVERRQVSSFIRFMLLKLRQLCAAESGFPRLQGIIAVLFLLYVGRRQTGRLPQSGRGRR